jgi:hypothetical protein
MTSPAEQIERRADAAGITCCINTAPNTGDAGADQPAAKDRPRRRMILRATAPASAIAL